METPLIQIFKPEYKQQPLMVQNN